MTKMSPINMSEAYEWSIGFFLIFVYAQGRFNTPRSNRSSTTNARYYVAALSYLFSLGLLFILLGGGLSASPELLTLFAGGVGGLPEETQRLAGGPLLAALILTALLPNFPVLSEVDGWLRGSFQRLGNIPWEAIRLSGKMRRSEFEVPSDLMPAINKMLSDFPQECIQPDPDRNMHHQWTKTTALYVQIMNWQDMKKYDSFIESLREDYRKIQSTFGRARDKALMCFKLMSNSANDVEGDISKATLEIRRDFEELHDYLFKQICDFIARGVLRCELGSIGRQTKLREMGFSKYSEERQPLTANQVVLIIVTVFLVLLPGIYLVGDSRPDIRYALFTALMVSLIYGLAVIAAIYPKAVWDFADIEKSHSRFFPAYFLSGFIAVLLGSVVSLTFRFVAYRDFMRAIYSFIWTHPWFLLSFTAALVISYLADDYAGKKREKLKRWSRWAEGAAAALILTLAAMVVHHWLLASYRSPPPPQAKVWLEENINVEGFEDVKKWFINYVYLPPGEGSSKFFDYQIDDPLPPAVQKWLGDGYKTPPSPPVKRWLAQRLSKSENDLPGPPIVQEWLMSERPPQLYQLLPITAAIGFALGMFVPHWYRTKPREWTVVGPDEQFSKQ